MTILTIGSTNPDFSHIVSKNPGTIIASKTPFERNVRKGKVYGWFNKSDNSQFRLLFRDSDLESSFVDQGEFEYLDKARYSHPYLPIQMIVEALRSASKGQEQDIAGFEAFVEAVIEIPNRILGRFRFKDVGSVTFDNVCNSCYRVRVVAPTVVEALNLFQMICIISTITLDDIYIPLNKEVIFKYLGSLQQANAPYSLRQLFISRAISNGKLFEMAKAEGLIDTPDFVFSYGNTQLQRLLSIKEALAQGRKDLAGTLIDIGCGELSHSFKLTERYDAIIGYDADPEVCRINDLKLKKRQVENITVINQMVTGEYVKENAGVFAETDVLVSEVLEHMEVKDAFKLVAALLETEAERIVVTVPCGEFNEFYGMGPEEVRHEDHKWEPNTGAWAIFVNAVCPVTRSVKFIDVGDKVKGIPCTMMAVFDNV